MPGVQTGQSIRSPAGREDQSGTRFRHEVLAVVFRVHDRRLEVLLWLRARSPFQDCWALPGGPLGEGERLGASLGRHLAVKVDLDRHRAPRTARDPQRPRPRPAGTRARHRVPGAGGHRRQPARSGRYRVAPGQRAPPHRVRPRVDHQVGPGAAARQALLHQPRLCPGPGHVHDQRAAGNLRGRPRPSGVSDQPAAHPGPARGHRTHPRDRAAGRGRRRPATLYRFAARTLQVTNPFAAFRPPPADT